MERRNYDRLLKTSGLCRFTYGCAAVGALLGYDAVSGAIVDVNGQEPERDLAFDQPAGVSVVQLQQRCQQSRGAWGKATGKAN